MPVLATILSAYLLGSIPFGLLLTRAAGLGDIRHIGSGSIGATNVLRTGRKGLAAATLLLDAAKGVLAAALLVPHGPAALCVVVGHCAPVWLRFRGGKGVATGLGALCGLDWRLAVLACLAWLATAALTRRSSAGALAACAAAPVAAALLPGAPVWPVVAIALIVIVRHRANIGRLVAGTEPAIGAGR
jgi:glycerol-3-phosphate acyltransferase PlsY